MMRLKAMLTSMIKIQVQKKVKEDLLGINYEIEGNETKLDKYETKNQRQVELS